MKEIESMIEEAKYEYEDRLSRLKQLNNDIKLLNIDLENVAGDLSDASLKVDETSNILNRMENRIEVLKNLLNDPFLR